PPSISLLADITPAGSSCAVSVNVTAATPGTYNNTSGAVSSTNGGTGNTAKATLTVAHANLTITKTHQGTFKRGQNGAVWTITVSASASGGSPEGSTLTVTQSLPTRMNPPTPRAISGTSSGCAQSPRNCTRPTVRTAL